MSNTTRTSAERGDSLAGKHYRNGFDLRITVYRTVKALLAAALLAFLVKWLLITTVRCDGTSMKPTILKGDRVLVLRLGSLPLLRSLVAPPIDKVIAFRSPFQEKSVGLLRVAACSGDTISIDSGRVITSHPLERTRSFSENLPEIVPPEFSPRDFFPWYRVPRKNDLLLISRLSLRDFFFTCSIIRQEHPGQTVAIAPVLLLDDSVCTSYTPSDFSLYSGALDSVPDSLRYDWFFWDRLEEYLYRKHDTRKVSLYFSLQLDGVELTEYRVSDDYYFLLADNRKSGFDSRYAGPVRADRCRGTARMVLWSFGGNEGTQRHFRLHRLGRFIR